MADKSNISPVLPHPTSHLTQAVALLSSTGEAIRMLSPVDTSLAPCTVGGGLLVIKLTNSFTSSSLNFMPAMPRSAVNSLSSARLSLTHLAGRSLPSSTHCSSTLLTLLPSSALSSASAGHLLLAPLLTQKLSQALQPWSVPSSRPDSHCTRSELCCSDSSTASPGMRHHSTHLPRMDRAMVGFIFASSSRAFCLAMVPPSSSCLSPSLSRWLTTQ